LRYKPARRGQETGIGCGLSTQYFTNRHNWFTSKHLIQEGRLRDGHRRSASSTPQPVIPETNCRMSLFNAEQTSDIPFEPSDDFSCKVDSFRLAMETS
jgi:hypothetical protein